MSIRFLLGSLLTTALLAGPVDFGRGEVQRAVAQRGLNPLSIRFNTEIDDPAQPDSYRIQPGLISGGNVRGLMYGLLEAADQIRLHGFLYAAKGEPAVAIRGVRLRTTNEALSKLSLDNWTSYIQILARGRFNRLHLVLDALPGDTTRLRVFSQEALEYGIDVALSSENDDPQLARVITECPAIRALHFEQKAFPADLGPLGRLLAWEIPEGTPPPPPNGAPLRFFRPLLQDGLGKPYIEPERLELTQPSTRQLVWQVSLPRLQTEFPYADPTFVRQAAQTFSFGGALGFEIEAPNLDSAWFYSVWGRLTFDPRTPDAVFQQPKSTLYRTAAEVLTQLNANRLPLSGVVLYDYPWLGANSLEASERLHAAALALDQAIGDDPAPEFRLLSLLARYHGRRVMAIDHLVYFFATGDDTGLHAARREVTGNLRVWEDVLKLADTLSPERATPLKEQMAWVQQDRKLMDERLEIWEKFGRFDYAFDFGDAAQRPEPRFRAVSPDTAYDDSTGFGWATPGIRTASPAAPTPMPGNFLFGDSISGTGAQTFRIKATPGEYRVWFLSPDHSVRDMVLQARDGVLNVQFPDGEWTFAGLVAASTTAKPAPTARQWPTRAKRPVILHQAVAATPPGLPLSVSLGISNPSPTSRVRLRYRTLLPNSPIETLEAPANRAQFQVPGSALTMRADLLYFFEVRQPDNTWIVPDPADNVPYYVVHIDPALKGPNFVPKPAPTPVPKAPPAVRPTVPRRR